MKNIKVGVEVYIIYDYLGNFFNAPKELFKSNFNVLCFNRYKGLILPYINIRNHRKICVIDGNVGYIGGLNIGDEYINQGKFKAIWKDSAIRCNDTLVNDLTIMFIDMWNLKQKDNKKITNNKDYLYFDEANSIDNSYDKCSIMYKDGFDTKNNIAREVYDLSINNAKKSIYIMTPYLMIDEKMISSLKVAKRRGVDIKIITPKVPDNIFVHCVTRCFYKDLLDENIDIYEYSLGFVHSKIACFDEDEILFSSINLDFRSFYILYENGIYINNLDVKNDINLDFENVLKNSEKITMENFKNEHKFVIFFKPFLKLIASVF